MMTALRNIFRNQFRITWLGFVLLCSHPAIAESDPNQAIAAMGQLGFTKSGAVQMPSAILQGIGGGQVNSFMIFIVMNHVMNQCIEDVLAPEYAIRMREPTVPAQAKFDYGMCRVRKCYLQSLLMLFGAEIRGSFSTHSGSDPVMSQSAQQLGATFMAGFGQDPPCAQGEDSGIASALIQVFQSN